MTSAASPARGTVVVEPPRAAIAGLPVLLTPVQVCEALHVTKDWLYDEVQADRFPVVRVGRQLRFDVEAIAEYLRAHSSGNVPTGSIR